LSAFTICSVYGISVAFFYPIFEGVSFTPLWIFIHGAGFGLFIILLPSIIQKRCEYSADAFAASMVGKEKYIKALIELDNLSNGLVSKGGLTHPTLKKRIDHINALQ